jgi:kinesin family member 11
MRNSARSSSVAAATHLNAIVEGKQRLIEEGIREDLPTGMTPMKRTWDYVEHWDLTKPREEVLSQWRKQRARITPVDSVARPLGDVDEDMVDADANEAIDLDGRPAPVSREEETPPTISPPQSSLSAALPLREPSPLPPNPTRPPSRAVPGRRVVSQPVATRTRKASSINPEQEARAKAALTERPMNVSSRRRVR